jgi:hypothetical protein
VWEKEVRDWVSGRLQSEVLAFLEYTGRTDLDWQRRDPGSTDDFVPLPSEYHVPEKSHSNDN